YPWTSFHPTETAMKRNNLAGAMLAGILLLASCAAMGPVKYADGVMVDSANMTLYTFDKDPVGGGKRACNAKRGGLGPAFKAEADRNAGGECRMVTREYVSKQWAYKGMPLYRWVKDQKPGDKTGDGVNKIWHVVKQPASSVGGSMY